jgi:SAM-dependent methyltransferase
MSLDLPPLHGDLTFLSPLSETRADRLVGFLTADHPADVLDLGCGWGELLLRVLEASPEARGRGVDQNEDAMAEGRARAARRGLADRVSFEAADARELSGTADAVVCIGASQIWGAHTDQPHPLDYSSALTALRRYLPRGGRLVYGEGIWSRRPTPEAIAPLAGLEDEYVDLRTLLDLAVDHGFAVVAAEEASLDEWDVFESGFTAGYAHWLVEHPADHPDAERVRELAARQRASYLGGYRGILGLAYLQLVAV